MLTLTYRNVIASTTAGLLVAGEANGLFDGMTIKVRAVSYIWP